MVSARLVVRSWAIALDILIFSSLFCSPTTTTNSRREGSRNYTARFFEDSECFEVGGGSVRKFLGVDYPYPYPVPYCTRDPAFRLKNGFARDEFIGCRDGSQKQSWLEGGRGKKQLSQREMKHREQEGEPGTILIIPDFSL